MKVIGVTGLPGSGKSVVSRVAKSLKIPIVRMGDVIRDEAEKRGSTPGEVAVKLREEYGEFVVAERCVESIKNLYNLKEKTSESSSDKLDDVYMIFLEWITKYECTHSCI